MALPQLTRLSHGSSSPVTPMMELKPNAGSDRAWVWNTHADFADECPKPELLAIRFLNAESKQQGAGPWGPPDCSCPSDHVVFRGELVVPGKCVVLCSLVLSGALLGAGCKPCTVSRVPMRPHLGFEVMSRVFSLLTSKRIGHSVCPG